VAAGVTEAAVLHLHSLATRLRLANREFRQAERERKLDGLCAVLTQTETVAERCCHSRVSAGRRQNYPRYSAHRSVRPTHSPGLQCAQDPVRGGAGYQEEWQDLRRRDARPAATAGTAPSS
jgi:hypothetical protein